MVFLGGWLAGALYVCLLAVHWLFGVPWRPPLNVAGVALFVLALGGFSAPLVGLCVHQARELLAGRHPGEGRGKGK